MAKQKYTKISYKPRSSVSKNLPGILSIIAAVAVMLIFGVAYGIKLNQVNEIDPKSFCKKQNPEETTVVLIDPSDGFNSIQKADLKRTLSEIASAVPKNSSIKILSINDNTNDLLSEQKPFCNPGDDSTVSNIDGSKVRAKLLYEARYKKEIDSSLDRIFSSKESAVSPIMEALQAVAISSFKGNKASKKQLILISDLIQNTKGLSMYKGVPAFEEFKNKSYWQAVKTDFSDVDVKIYLVHRNDGNAIQNNFLKNFWKYYFIEQQSAGSPDIQDIDGQS